MIITEIYNGQGLGNQLWCYVVTRVIAKDKGYKFGIKSPEKFKCNDFLNLDFGKKVIGGTGPEGGPPIIFSEGIKYYYNERKITHPINGSDIRIHDKNLVNILDNTKIDGIMQDEQYIIHRKNEIREWLRVKKEYECYDFSNDNICVINFRGGEYTKIKNVFLPQKYWDDAVKNMKKINKNFKFVVITDDVETAKTFFPNFDVFHFSIAKDYVIVKNAKYLILSNSSFAWFPVWLNENLKYCIAPKYWSQYNTSDGFWGCGYNITSSWLYQDRDGNLQDYDSCLKELNEYNKNYDYFIIEKINVNYLFIPYYNAIKNFASSSNQIKKNILFLIKKNIPRPIKSAIRKAINKKNPTNAITPKEERKIFDLLKDKFEIVFDVGARDELSFYNMKKNCVYHLFEPNAKFVALLKKKIASFENHNIKINEFGLSDKKADNCIYYEKSQSFIMNPVLNGGVDIDTGHRYSLRTLDDYATKNNIPKIDFLKIDTEGLDYKIILGGLNTIKNKVSYIQFEYWDGVKKFSEILDNFDLYLMMEPTLLKAIRKLVIPIMTPEQKKISYNKSLIKLNNDVINLIDKKLIPIGCGGNIFGVSKNVAILDVKKLMFDL